MKELVVISGKGGSGKTSLVGSLFALAENAVVADCDVDAADLHLILSPMVERREDFQAGAEAIIDQQQCIGCGKCYDVCRFDAIRAEPYRVVPTDCEGCGACLQVCAAAAIRMEPTICGQWFVSETRHGPMVHARLGIGSENSGKLVSLVRTQAKQRCLDDGRDLLLVDGPPGIGCPVIASIGGADLVLAATEPTPSGLHDLERVAQLARHFDIPIVVCINKWDLNAEMSGRIERRMQAEGIPVVGRIRYDDAVTKAQIAGLTVVELADRNTAGSDGEATGIAADIKNIWHALQPHLARAGRLVQLTISKKQEKQNKENQ